MHLPSVKMVIQLPANLCLSSAVASRLISLGAAFYDTLTVVVPEK